MNLSVIGINHKTAPIEIREKLFLNATEQKLILSEFKSHPKVCEAFVLSTCNRTEVYAHLISDEKDLTFITDFIFAIKKLQSIPNFKKYVYTYRGEDAVKHLFDVSSGLDSLVLGEKQILGQVKNAFTLAQSKTMFGKSFNILSNTAIRAGKMARNDTGISVGGSSVGWAAVVQAELLLGSFEGKSVLIIGAGKMSKMSIKQIVKKGAKTIYIMNRTEEIARGLAEQFNAIPAAFCDIKEILTEVDICFCAASAPHYILEKPTVEKIMHLRKNRELVLIDISMPRNIDPCVGEVNNTNLLMIDDLDKFVDENMQSRQNAIPHVEQIVQRKVKEFYRKVNKLHASDLGVLVSAQGVEKNRKS